jgi:hypothetical protein
VPHAEKRSRGEFVDAEILVEIGVNPGAELLESVGAVDLESEWLGKLPLASGALVEHNHLSCDRERRIGAEVVFDQREGEVDARRDAGGRVVLARLDVDRIGVDVEPWESPFDVGDRCRVRRDLVAVKKAGGRESVETGAYAGDASNARLGRPDPCSCPLGDSRFVEPGAARNDERVQLDIFAHGGVRTHLDPGARVKPAAGESDHHHLVWGSFGIELVKRVRRKCVGGADEVEPLDTVECEKTNVPLLHGLYYRPRISWQQ